jgi:hypothetical protein
MASFPAAGMVFVLKRYTKPDAWLGVHVQPAVNGKVADGDWV